MDIQRMLLVVIFGMSALFLWNEWQRLVNPPPPATQAPSAIPAPTASPSPSTPAPSAAPAAPATNGSVPSASSLPAAPSATPSVPSATPAPVATSGERVTLESDLLRLVVNTAGGVIEEAELKTQQGTLDKTQPYQLLLNTKDRVHLAQAGLLGDGLPNHKTIYAAEAGPRKLDGADKLQLRLSAPITQGPAAGGKVVQLITLKKGSYLVDVTFEVTNPGQSPLPLTAYFHLLRDNKMPAGESSMVPTYTGPAIYDRADNFKKVDWSDIEKKKAKYTAKTDNGWVAMIEHYFVAAIIAPDKIEREIYTDKLDDGNYRAGVKITPQPVAAGATGRIEVPY
jgi:YidC/Oxa1 family membrane protein insertase